MGIYTKKGDAGATSNLLDHFYRKDDLCIQLMGEIDEINANIGYLRSIGVPDDMEEDLKRIQHNLYALSTEASSEFTDRQIETKEVKYLEECIDKMTDSMGKLKYFIYQSGCQSAAYTHVVRTVVRRCERTFVTFLSSKNTTAYPPSYQYINRMSDYFFTVARYINWRNNIPDELLHLDGYDFGKRTDK